MSDKDFMKLILQEKVKEEFPEKTATESVTGEQQLPLRRHVDSKARRRGSERTEKSVKPVTRYIVSAKKRKTVSQTQGKCGYPGCNRPFEVIHHPERFSECKNHNLLVPLCKIYHEFAHNNLIQNETSPTANWKISLTESTQQADILYRKFRREVVA